MSSVILFIVVVAWFVIRLSGAKKNSAVKTGKSSSTNVPQKPAPKRRVPATQFTAPDAHCVVCENTGEDHFVRDKVRRIAQLDDWLKNGLIDRAEYRVLKGRFERDE